MKQLLTVMAIMVCAYLTQGFTTKDNSSSASTGKPVFNYGKFMRSLWLDTRKNHGVKMAGSLEVRNWNDSWATINYIYLRNDNVGYFRVLLHDWEPPIVEGRSREVFYDTNLPQVDLIIGLTVTGPTSGGGRAIFVEDGNFNNLICLENVLTSGEYTLPNVNLYNNLTRFVNIFEYCH